MAVGTGCPVGYTTTQLENNNSFSKCSPKKKKKI
jgi:hypothetical protein